MGATRNVMDTYDMNDTASAVMGKAKEAMSSVVHTVGDAGTAVVDKANEATTAVGVGMKTLAGTIRDHMPTEGVLGAAPASVARSLESGGRYLESEGLGGITNEVANVVRRHPIPSLLVGIGLGVFLARLAMRSHRDGK
jgi:hypothetical protein